VVVDTVGILNKFSGCPSDGDKPKGYPQSGSIHNLKKECHGETKNWKNYETNIYSSMLF